MPQEKKNQPEKYYTSIIPDKNTNSVNKKLKYFAKDNF